jgi:hypothetical protein
MQDNKEKVNKLPEGTRIFRSARYLLEIEPKTFGTFFDIIEQKEEDSLSKVRREKLKTLGPTAIYRECEGNEKADMETFHPSQERVMKLKLIEKF